MKSYWYLGYIFLLALLVMSSGTELQTQAAPEATYIVNTTADTHDANPGSYGCVDSTGKCSLRAAIEEANAIAGADTITLPAGTYNLNNHLSISEGLTINGGGEATTIINGATPAISGGIQTTAGNLTLNDLTIQHFYFGLQIFDSTARTITLENISIQNNSHTDGNNSGAGIRQYCAACTLNLSNTDIEDNAAPACAGISNYGTANISNNSHISGNTATSTIGGGICNRGALAVSQSYIDNNEATAGTNSYGGGIHHNGSSLTIFLSEMYSNNAYMGGALYDSGDDISIQFSSIYGNSATSGGGGIFLGVDGSVYMDHASLTNNDAAYGGGIYSYADDAEIRYSTVVSNTTTFDGGGFYIQDGVMTVVNSTISGNQADHDGGGVFVKYGGVKLASTTLSNNTADMDDNGDGIAGGIYVHDSADDVRFKNTIIAGNEDLTASPFEIYYPDCRGDLISDGFNLVGRVTVLCNISGDLSGNQIGISSVINPGLGGLIHGSYDAYYHPLVWFSPAVNRANPAGCKDYDNVTIADDQPGEMRHWGRCDVGAVESHINRKDLYLPVVLR